MAIEMQQLQRPEQRMILTPQMQQAIHLLQAPLQEMSSIIDQEMVSNPVLEEEPVGEGAAPETAGGETPETSGETEFREEFNRLSTADDEWRDYFHQTGSSHRYQARDEEESAFLESLVTRGETLGEHLQAQARGISFSEREKKIADAIIGNIDRNGYLSEPLEEIAREAGAEVSEAEKVLPVIQKLHPPGVAARDVKECLLLQIESREHADPLAAEIVDKHLDDLGRRRYPQIARVLKTTPERVQRAAEYIATLDPRPGGMFDTDEVPYLTPDVFLEKTEDGYTISFNSEYLPHLRINDTYRALMNGPESDSSTRTYIKDKVKAGLWLIKNIRLRQETLSKITAEIVSRQRQFLDKGPSFLVPLKMAEIAQTVGIHESTVSRAVSNKYIQTPQGLLPMKFFFSGALASPAGTGVASASVKEEIGRIIREENPHHPWSDQEIEEMLTRQGIKLARRTVTKYRKSLNILSSHLRKKY
jgi:RNA polymerase sigma-54 factor